MTNYAPLETLFYAFDTDALTPPEGRALFINAQSHNRLKSMDVDCLQNFYPFAHGLFLADQVSAPYQMALVLVSKDKTSAQYEMAQAFEALNKQGLLVACAANDANGNRLESWFEDMGMTPHSLSKNKCRVVWAVKDEQAVTPFEWLMRGPAQQVELDGVSYWSQPGVFGWDKIDTGSRLLVQHLPDKLSGNGADFGCGYGYLTRHLQGRGAQSILAVDADRRAIDCCVKNVPEATGLWRDLTQAWEGASLDWVVMNPPFHMGKMTDSDIGAAFIKTAVGALKKGGWLYMVANRQLPYEDILRSLCSRVEMIEQAQGFKIIFAQK